MTLLELHYKQTAPEARACDRAPAPADNRLDAGLIFPKRRPVAFGRQARRNHRWAVFLHPRADNRPNLVINSASEPTVRKVIKAGGPSLDAGSPWRRPRCGRRGGAPAFRDTRAPGSPGAAGLGAGLGASGSGWRRLFAVPRRLARPPATRRRSTTRETSANFGWLASSSKSIVCTVTEARRRPFGRLIGSNGLGDFFTHLRSKYVLIVNLSRNGLRGSKPIPRRGPVWCPSA